MTTMERRGLHVCECGEYTYSPTCGGPCRQPAPEAQPEPTPASAEPEPAGTFRFTVEPLPTGRRIR